MSLLETILHSTDWLTVLLAVMAIVAVWAYVQWSKMPPGPIGIPYFGYYPFLSKDCHFDLWELSKKYGKVFCFKATGQMYAHIIDMKTLREVSVTKSDCFETKPTNFNMFSDMFGGGIFLLNGEHWKITRKFFVTQFKELGMGKRAQEGVIHDSLKDIVDSLNRSGGKNFNCSTFFIGKANDVMSHMIFGSEQLDVNDVKDFHTAYTIASEFSNSVRILVAGPFLKYFLIPFHPAYSSYRKNKKQVDTIMTKIVRRHEQKLNKNHLTNLVDIFINERKSLEEKKDPKAKYFSEKVLVHSFVQFYGDGALGTGYLAASALSAIASRPDIQKNIQAELDEVIGRNRLPSFDDRSRLQYTNAVIYENQRLVRFFPVLPSVECTKETTIGGCRIPKGTVATYNMWAILHDSNVYDDPYKFDPTRFISVDGKKPRCEIPTMFGAGKRSCIGEPLVTMQVMLYVATVLQNFDLHPPEKIIGSKHEEWEFLLRATPRSA